MSSSLLFAVALVACLAAHSVSAQSSPVTNPLLLACNSTFFATLEAGSDTGCQVYEDLAECLTTVVLQASSSSLEAMLDGAELVMTIALGAPTTCDTNTLSFAAAKSNIPLDLASGQTVQVNQVTVNSYGSNQAADALMTVATGQEMLMNTVSDTIAQGQTTLSPITNTLVDAVNVMYAPSVSKLGQRPTSFNARINAIKASINAVPTSVNNAQTSISSQLSSETSARVAVANTWAASLTTLETLITTRGNAAAADRSTIRASRPNNNPTTSIAAQFSAASVTEASRSTAEAATQSTAFASVVAGNAAALTPRISTEASRADAACSTSVGTIAFIPPKLNNATQDNNVCTATGQLYYSLASNAMYLCNGSTWLPFLSSFTTSPFACSSIMSAATQEQMYRLLGKSYTYQRCFSAPTHGWSSYTQGNLCNGRGNGALWVIRNNYGWIHGGFADVALIGSYGYRFSWGMFTYRVSTQSGLLELAYPMGYGAGSYGIYDYNQGGYCIAFGGGHDTYVSSSCQSGHTYCYTYYNNQINFFQTSSYCGFYTPCPSCLYVSDIEVWIRY